MCTVGCNVRGLLHWGCCYVGSTKLGLHLGWDVPAASGLMYPCSMYTSCAVTAVRLIGAAEHASMVLAQCMVWTSFAAWGAQVCCSVLGFDQGRNTSCPVCALEQCSHLLKASLYMAC